MHCTWCFVHCAHYYNRCTALYQRLFWCAMDWCVCVWGKCNCSCIQLARAEQQNSGLVGDASDLHYNSMSCQCKTLHWHNHYIAGWFLGKTLWHCIAKHVHWGGSLQNVCKGVQNVYKKGCKTCNVYNEGWFIGECVQGGWFIAISVQ